ncbi:MAG: hypothetical protein Q8P36_01890 [bacterium]|nr:hypothetical protein [bacterium]
MNERGAAFYFANLGADAARCLSALARDDEERYQDSLEQAYRTLDYLRGANRPEAYEEGLLLLRGLALAHDDPTLRARYGRNLNTLIAPYAEALTTIHKGP